MDEYISKNAFLEHMKKTSRYFSVKYDLEAFPAADVAPVVHGRWVEHEFEDEPCFGTEYECSACGKFQYGDSKYCPNCGAKMDGGDS